MKPAKSLPYFDIFSHTLLIFVIFLGILAVYNFRFEAKKQYFVIILVSLFYLMWAIAFHWAKGDINRKLFLEYLSVAAITLGAGFLVFLM